MFAVTRAASRGVRAACVVAITLVWAPVAAFGQSPQYTYADNADNVGNGAVINNAGSVLVQRAGNLYTGADTMRDRVASAGYAWRTGGAINDGGTVAYEGSGPNNVVGVYRRTARGGTGANGGPPPEAVATNAAYQFFQFSASSPAINNAGTVAFFARALGGSDGIFVGPDPVADRIAVVQLGGAFSSINHDFTSINNAGVVAFGAGLGGSGEGIFTNTRGGTPTSVANSGGAFDTFSAPRINNNGLVAFSARLDDGSAGVFTGPNPVAGAVATTAGPYAGFGPGAALQWVDVNDAGTVLFYATLDNQPGGGGLYTGPDPMADKVIAIGDTLFGQRVTQVGFRPGALNDLGQIAFGFTLADGRVGVAVATPVPEPGGMVVVVGVAGALLRRRRKA